MRCNQYLIFSTKGIKEYQGKADIKTLAEILNENNYHEYDIYEYVDKEHRRRLIDLYFEACLKLEAE